MSLKNSVVYDIETHPSLIMVDGNIKASNKLSVAVTFDESSEYKFWYEEDAIELIEYLLQFDKIIGFNIKHFDNAILSHYLAGSKEELDKKSVDMLEIVENRLGHRLTLQAIVSATLKVAKSADGDQAVKWWQNGQQDKVAEYCKDDVSLTKDIYLYGVTNGQIFYDSFGEIRKLKIDWNNPKANFNSSSFTYQLIDDETGNVIDLDKENVEFIQALDLARTTNRLIYLTGKAGTGKTTFLKYLKSTINKKAIVVAYTGVAAINAGGQTIHSFFQLNPDEPPFLPNDIRLRTRGAIQNHF